MWSDLLFLILLNSSTFSDFNLLIDCFSMFQYWAAQAQRPQPHPDPAHPLA